MRGGRLRRYREVLIFISSSPALLSRAETAHLLGISTVTLDRLIRGRKGPRSVRIGRRVLFRAAAVERWIAQRQRAAR